MWYLKEKMYYISSNTLIETYSNLPYSKLIVKLSALASGLHINIKSH